MVVVTSPLGTWCCLMKLGFGIIPPFPSSDALQDLSSNPWLMAFFFFLLFCLFVSKTTLLGIAREISFPSCPLRPRAQASLCPVSSQHL